MFLRFFANFAAVVVFLLITQQPVDVFAQNTSKDRFWEIQSVDTTKYSRDLSREKLRDAAFDGIIEEQVKRIAETGATHVAIGTPYDEEFLPMLKRWVAAARKNNLQVWFRGNWSGWEGWFEYKKINREEHIEKTTQFIIDHPELFENGDIFTGCPECENGGPGDPRRNGDLAGHRMFLIEEYAATKKAFQQIGRTVRSNIHSMNGDVARIVMDKETTRSLGGIVAIDHYVATPEQLVSDIKEIAEQSGGRIVLSELGVPIPDIHGPLSETEQATWLRKVMSKIVAVEDVIGINYWVNVGGSTEIWTASGKSKLAAEVLSSFYDPQTLSGRIINELDRPVPGSSISGPYRTVQSDNDGFFHMPILKNGTSDIHIAAADYLSADLVVHSSDQPTIKLVREKKSLWFRILLFFHSLFR